MFFEFWYNLTESWEKVVIFVVACSRIWTAHAHGRVQTWRSEWSNSCLNVQGSVRLISWTLHAFRISPCMCYAISTSCTFFLDFYECQNHGVTNWDVNSAWYRLDRLCLFEGFGATFPRTGEGLWEPGPLGGRMVRYWINVWCPKSS